LWFFVTAGICLRHVYQKSGKPWSSTTSGPSSLDDGPCVTQWILTPSESMLSAAWSAPVSEITSLEMACARLGVNVVRSVSIALAIASPFDASRCPTFEGQRFWCTALLNADAAFWLAPLARAAAPVEPQTARTGGLLHNLGLLWLADQLPDATNQALSTVAADPELGEYIRQLKRREFAQ